MLRILGAFFSTLKWGKNEYMLAWRSYWDTLDITECITNDTIHRIEAGEKGNLRIPNCRLSNHIMWETDIKINAEAGTINVTEVIDRKRVKLKKIRQNKEWPNMEALSNLSNQPHMNWNVKTTDTQYPTRFGTSWLQSSRSLCVSFYTLRTGP
jgi:hypothetical protein